MQTTLQTWKSIGNAFDGLAEYQDLIDHKGTVQCRVCDGFGHRHTSKTPGKHKKYLQRKGETKADQARKLLRDSEGARWKADPGSCPVLAKLSGFLPKNGGTIVLRMLLQARDLAAAKGTAPCWVNPATAEQIEDAQKNLDDQSGFERAYWLTQGDLKPVRTQLVHQSRGLAGVCSAVEQVGTARRRIWTLRYIYHLSLGLGL